MKILGISAYYHDSAATITIDGKVLAAAQEERFTRKKHDAAFPTNAVSFCLEFAGLAIDELDAIVFYDKPFLKFERLLETYYAFAPKGLLSFWKAIPVWIKEKLFLKKLLKDELKKFGKVDWKRTKLLFPDHHLSHAASAFYPSPFDEAAILTLDGVGEWATASICHGKGKDITLLRELRFPHSLGLLYSAFTYFLGFRVNSGEYKLMGLAPYGNAGSAEVAKYKAIILSKLIDLKEDGSIWLDQRFFNYAAGLRMVKDKKWANLFGFPRREAEAALEQRHCDLGLAIQEVTEEIVLRMAQEAKRLTEAKNLCLAGGVALNCVANGKLQSAGIFENIFIVPAAGDAGGSLGAALAAEHISFGQERSLVLPDGLEGAYLGPEYSAKEIVLMARKYKAVATQFAEYPSLAEKAASLLADGNVVGWFQGRMEFGPRALGNRSIIGDARNAEMQKKLNLKIKYRESFRPFAPSVLEEYAGEYFTYARPLALHAACSSRFAQPIAKRFPPTMIPLTCGKSLYHLRSDVPSITHIDFSARIQTVSKKTNPRYWTAD
jgi:carbamoyltransferase